MQCNVFCVCNAMQRHLFLQRTATCSVCTATCLVFAMQCNAFCVCTAMQCIQCLQCNATQSLFATPCNLFCLLCNVFSVCNATCSAFAVQCNVCSVLAMHPVWCLKSNAMCSVFAMQCNACCVRTAMQCNAHRVCNAMQCVQRLHRNLFAACNALQCTPFGLCNPAALCTLFARSSFAWFAPTHSTCVQIPPCTVPFARPRANSPLHTHTHPRALEKVCKAPPPSMDRTPLHAHN